MHQSFADYVKEQETLVMNRFSIDFTLAECPAREYDFISDLFKTKGNFIDCKITSKRIFYSELCFDDVVKIVKTWKDIKNDDKFIITDYTNHKATYIGVDDNVEKFFS